MGRIHIVWRVFKAALASPGRQVPLSPGDKTFTPFGFEFIDIVVTVTEA